MPANQKSIQLLLFRKYTHCYQHSSKGWLNYGPQSFETCITCITYITISIFMKHSIIIRYSITVLIYCHIDIYRRSLLCACAVYASARAYICVCVYIYTQVSSSLLEYVKIYHRGGTFNKHSSLAIFNEHLVRQTNQGLP